MGTDCGAGRFDGKSWTTYTEADGLPGGVILIAVAPDGTVWFSSGDTVTRYVLPADP